MGGACRWSGRPIGGRRGRGVTRWTTRRWTRRCRRECSIKHSCKSRAYMVPAESEAETQTRSDEQRGAVARHLRAKLEAALLEPVGGKGVPARAAGRFMLFATPLVAAILDGRKTMTRR